MHPELKTAEAETTMEAGLIAANGSAVPVWLTVPEAAARAQCGDKIIYRAVTSGRLRAARIGGRRELRIRPEWVDAWLEASAQPLEIVPSRRAAFGRGVESRQR